MCLETFLSWKFLLLHFQPALILRPSRLHEAMTPVERTEPAALTIYFLPGPQSQAAEPCRVYWDDSPALHAGSAPLLPGAPVWAWIADKQTMEAWSHPTLTLYFKTQRETSDSIIWNLFGLEPQMHTLPKIWVGMGLQPTGWGSAQESPRGRHRPPNPHGIRVLSYDQRKAGVPSGECATPAAGIAHTRLSPEPFSEGKTMAGHKLPLNLGHRFPFILPSKGAKRATGSQISHLEITKMAWVPTTALVSMNIQVLRKPWSTNVDPSSLHPSLYHSHLLLAGMTSSPWASG